MRIDQTNVGLARQSPIFTRHSVVCGRWCKEWAESLVGRSSTRVPDGAWGRNGKIHRGMWIPGLLWGSNARGEHQGPDARKDLLRFTVDKRTKHETYLSIIECTNGACERTLERKTQWQVQNA